MERFCQSVKAMGYSDKMLKAEIFKKPIDPFDHHCHAIWRDSDCVDASFKYLVGICDQWCNGA